jgi:hypothetical protein
MQRRDKCITESRRYSEVYQVTEIKMVGTCRKSGRHCNAKENEIRKIVFQKKKRPRMRWLEEAESDLKEKKLKG